MNKIESIYFYIIKISKILNTENRILEQLKINASEKQLLKFISFDFMDKNKNHISKFIIEIDWNNYEIILSGINENYFVIDMQNSDICKNLNIKKIIEIFIDSSLINECFIEYFLMFQKHNKINKNINVYFTI